MKRLLVFTSGVVLVLICAFIFSHHELIHTTKAYIAGAHRFSQLAYVFLLFSVGVYLPLNAIPLIPFGAGIFGPLQGLILSIVGWVSGASCAFLISRKYGRTAILNFVPIEKVDRILESIPQERRFLALLIFRFVLPSDMASYALGLTKSLSFKHYFIATLVSYTCYATMLSFLGHSILRGEFLNAFYWAIGALAVFTFSWYLLNRLRN